MFVMLRCSVFAVTVGTAALAVAASPHAVAASAASAPASAASGRSPVESPELRVLVRFGDKKPGVPAPSRLRIPAMNIDVETDANGERRLPMAPNGKIRMKVFVAGGDPCEVDFAAAANKQITVKVFIPKRGSGATCEHTLE